MSTTDTPTTDNTPRGVPVRGGSVGAGMDFRRFGPRFTRGILRGAAVKSQLEEEILL